MARISRHPFGRPINFAGAYSLGGSGALRAINNGIIFDQPSGLPEITALSTNQVSVSAISLAVSGITALSTNQVSAQETSLCVSIISGLALDAVAIGETSLGTFSLTALTLGAVNVRASGLVTSSLTALVNDAPRAAFQSVGIVETILSEITGIGLSAPRHGSLSTGTIQIEIAGQFIARVGVGFAGLGQPISSGMGMASVASNLASMSNSGISGISLDNPRTFSNAVAISQVGATSLARAIVYLHPLASSQVYGNALTSPDIDAFAKGKAYDYSEPSNQRDVANPINDRDIELGYVERDIESIYSDRLIISPKRIAA